MAVEWKKVALYDEVASLSDAAPEAVGTAAAAGTGTDASRNDHVHDLGADCIDSGDLIADDVVDTEHLAAGAVDTTALGADAVNGDKIADGAVGSEHIEALSAALDFAGNQATDHVIHTVADATARDALTPVVGKMVWQTDEGHPYVCTSAA